MPFGKITTKTLKRLNRPYRKYKRRKIKATALQTAKKALRVAQQGKETHKFSNFGTNQRAGSDFVAYQLSNMAEGDTSETREGLKIYAKKLTMKILAQWDASANATDEPLRIMVVMDKNSNGALPTVGDIIEATSSTYSTVANRNRETEGKRFVFLYDKTFVNPYGDANNVHRKFINIDLSIAKNIYYLSSATSATAMGTNQLYLFLLADQTLASAVGPQCWWSNRLYFDP